MKGELSIDHVCGALVREQQQPGADHAEMLWLLMRWLELLVRREQERPQLTSSEKLVRHAEILMRTHFAEGISIHEVARRAGASPSHLRSQFLRLRGVSPLAYLQQVRLGHAKELLRTLSLTLDAIAELCSYHSASHLSRHIVRATGKSPGAFRCSG